MDESNSKIPPSRQSVTETPKSYPTAISAKSLKRVNLDFGIAVPIKKKRTPKKIDLSGNNTCTIEQSNNSSLDQKAEPKQDITINFRSTFPSSSFLNTSGIPSLKTTPKMKNRYFAEDDAIPERPEFNKVVSDKSLRRKNPYVKVIHEETDTKSDTKPFVEYRHMSLPSLHQKLEE